MSLSLLHILPKSIFKFIIDKLTFYEFYPLGACNKFFYNLTLNSSDFWKHRYELDFDLTIASGETNNPKVDYRNCVDFLRSYKNCFEDSTNFYQSLCNSHSVTFYDFSSVINNIVKCHLWKNIEKQICTIIGNTIKVSIINSHGVFVDQSRKRSFILSLTSIKFIWNNCGKYRKEIFNHDFVFACVDHKCLTVIDKFVQMKGVVGITVGLNMLARVLSRKIWGYNVPNKIINKALELIDCNIKSSDHFIKSGGINSFAGVIFQYKLNKGYFSEDTVSLVTNKLLTRLTTIEPILSRKIYDDLLAKCNDHPDILNWLLSHSLTQGRYNH